PHQRFSTRGAILARWWISTKVDLERFSANHDLKTLRTISQKNETCEFVPPKRFATVKVASGEEDRGGEVCRRQAWLCRDQVVDVAIIKGQGHSICWQSAGHEIADKFCKRNGSASTIEDTEVLFEVARRYSKAPMIDRIVCDPVIHEN